jgi:hypothetical protein
MFTEVTFNTANRRPENERPKQVASGEDQGFHDEWLTRVMDRDSMRVESPFSPGRLLFLRLKRALTT